MFSLRLRMIEPGRFWLGNFGTDITDEVILAIQQVDPVPWLEIHCHGGVAVVRWIMEALAGRGIQVCSWQELERFTSGNLLRSAAAAALAEARTFRTAAILLDQYHGAFEQAIEQIIQALDSDDRETGRRLLEELARYTMVGRHLTSSWKVVIAGAPNVGKSSLVNALAGYQRSVVSPVPGTTRDVVATTIALDGWPVEVSDTAGWRQEATGLEQQGLLLASSAIDVADLCLWVLDGSVPPVWPTWTSDKLRLVINKTDLPAAWDCSTARDALHVSALSGAGVADLCQAVAGWLVPLPPPTGTAVPFTAATCDRVEQAWQLLKAGEQASVRGMLAGLL